MIEKIQNQEIIYHLLEDVKLISDTFASGLPKPVFVRTTFVPLLRKWIVEGGFHKTAKLIGPVEAKFEIITTPNDVKLCKAGVYENWMAVIIFGGVGVGTYLPVEKYRANPPARPPHVKALHGASTFFNQRIFFWKGKFYTRHDIIKLHANKLGGVHLNFERQSDERYIDEIKNYFGYELSPHTRQMLMGGDVQLARADPARRDRVYDAIELVSIDTADIFAKGVLASRSAFERAIK